MNNLEIIKSEDVNNLINEINEAFSEIPFENSLFQTENFIVKASLTPERAYRNIGLRMNNRIRALQEAKYNIKKNDIEIEKKKRKIDKLNKEKPEDWDLDAELIQMEIDKDLLSREYTNKLAKDAITELSYLYGLFKQLPKYTREEFENSEKVYFTEKLTDQILKLDGAGESLRNLLKEGDPIEVLNTRRNFDDKNLELMLGKANDIMTEEKKRIGLLGPVNTTEIESETAI